MIGVYGMGLTQQAYGTANVGMLVNLLLLRGNIGHPGAGCCPVRGHSNVQGQRTVGVAEKVALVPIAKLRELFGFEPPQEDGMHIVDAAEALVEGRLQAMLCLGGNLLRAMPDGKRLEAAWPKQQLTVIISTKLNRSHLVSRQVSFHLTLPQPLGGRRAGERKPIRDHRGQFLDDPWLDRQEPAGLRQTQVGAGDRGRFGQGGDASEPQGEVGRLDRRLFVGPRFD